MLRVLIFIGFFILGWNISTLISAMLDKPRDNERVRNVVIIIIVAVMVIVGLNAVKSNQLSKEIKDFIEVGDEVEEDTEEEQIANGKDEEPWVENEEEIEEVEEVVTEEVDADGTERELGAGTYKVEEHIPSGVYDVTFTGTGNYVVKDEDGELMVNVIGGSGKNAVEKHRTILIKGATIELSGTGATFMATGEESNTDYTLHQLHSGYWVGGVDVGEGRYIIQAIDGKTGNLTIHSKTGALKTNEIIGDMKYAVPTVTVDIEVDDLINASGVNIKLIPSE